MYCQSCGVEAPTKYVSYHQNIGALVMRFSKSVEGHLCKNCVHKHFWSLTGTTALLGWWGLISFIVTPFFLLNNVVRYGLCLGMEPVPPGAVPPRLDEEAVERIQRHAQRLFERLSEGEDLSRVVTDTADRAGVTPGQVMLFVQAVVQSQQTQ
jgi:hypothetical protein